MITEQGQILRGSPLGEMLYRLAMRDDVQNIVEIGTWLGGGSTLCILDGIRDSLKGGGGIKPFYSLEADLQKHLQAVENLRRRVFIHTRLIRGRITKLVDLDRENLSPVEKRWLAEDEANYETCPNVLAELPDAIGVLLLDAGEFSSYAEFKLLEARTNIIVLDDTVASRKNRRARQEILAAPDKWDVLCDVTQDRGGWMVAQRISR